jgi:hypothetical protein
LEARPVPWRAGGSQWCASRCTNAAPRYQAAQALNAAYQNFYTAVEVNAALSLSLRIVVRARSSRRLRAAVWAAGIKRIARISDVERSKLEAFVNQRTLPHCATIAKIDRALLRHVPRTRSKRMRRKQRKSLRVSDGPAFETESTRNQILT